MQMLYERLARCERMPLSTVLSKGVPKQLLLVASESACQ